jgi:hypothetical protein
MATFEEQHESAGMMSYPPITEPDFAEHPHCSVHACADSDCQAGAAEYIREQTGQLGVFTPFQAVRP